MSNKQNLALLDQPFYPSEYEWRIGRVISNQFASVLCYVTNRAIMARLDEAFGKGNWFVKFEHRVIERTKETWKDKNKVQVTAPMNVCDCYLSCWFESQQRWVTFHDGSEYTDVESYKGAMSSAMKRAAVHLGIGRILYELEETKVSLGPRGQKYVRHKGQNYYWNPPLLSDYFIRKDGQEPPTLPSQEVEGQDIEPDQSFVTPGGQPPQVSNHNEQGQQGNQPAVQSVQQPPATTTGPGTVSQPSNGAVLANTNSGSQAQDLDDGFQTHSQSDGPGAPVGNGPNSAQTQSAPAQSPAPPSTNGEVAHAHLPVLQDTEHYELICNDPYTYRRKSNGEIVDGSGRVRGEPKAGNKKRGSKDKTDDDRFFAFSESAGSNDSQTVSAPPAPPANQPPGRDEEGAYGQPQQPAGIQEVPGAMGGQQSPSSMGGDLPATGTAVQNATAAQGPVSPPSPPAGPPSTPQMPTLPPDPNQAPPAPPQQQVQRPEVPQQPPGQNPPPANVGVSADKLAIVESVRQVYDQCKHPDKAVVFNHYSNEKGLGSDMAQWGTPEIQEFSRALIKLRTQG